MDRWVYPTVIAALLLPRQTKVSCQPCELLGGLVPLGMRTRPDRVWGPDFGSSYLRDVSFVDIDQWVQGCGLAEYQKRSWGTVSLLIGRVCRAGHAQICCYRLGFTSSEMRRLFGRRLACPWERARDQNGRRLGTAETAKQTGRPGSCAVALKRTRGGLHRAQVVMGKETQRSTTPLLFIFRSFYHPSRLCLR